MLLSLISPAYIKAAVFYGKNDLRIKETDIPKAKADEVVIKAMTCGICGTDIHIYECDEGVAATPAGTVLGHEFSYRQENNRLLSCAGTVPKTKALFLGLVLDRASFLILSSEV